MVILVENSHIQSVFDKDLAALPLDGELLTWRTLDVGNPATIEKALTGCQAAVYLIHGMAKGGDYEAREARSALAAPNKALFDLWYGWLQAAGQGVE